VGTSQVYKSGMSQDVKKMGTSHVIWTWDVPVCITVWDVPWSLGELGMSLWAKLFGMSQGHWVNWGYPRIIM
jgi:hypothetical protein